MKMFPQVVTFRITSRCNNDCKYCYGPKNIKEMSFSELKKLFHLFHAKGIKAVVLTGGEPLLREDIVEVFKELKNYNFKIFLDTDGDFFFKHKDYINECVNVLGLPLDHSSKNQTYRSPKNFGNILKILNYYKKITQKKPLLRIGTVVTKENIKDLKNIAELLKDYKIDIWKIYEFIPSGVSAVINKKSLEIDSASFEKETNLIKIRYSKYFKIIISKRSDRTNAHFLINPDGTVFMPNDNLKNCEEIILGNVFDKDILNKWKKLVSEANYTKNTEITFNYKF